MRIVIPSSAFYIPFKVIMQSIHPFLKYGVAYLATLTIMVALDLLWLGLVAKPIYQRGTGHLMAPEPDIAVAALFYAIFALGLMIFAVVPHAAAAGWSHVVVYAALFGFFTYATYDLTNLATLRNWPIGLSILDIGWGTLVSALSASAGKAVLGRLSSG